MPLILMSQYLEAWRQGEGVRRGGRRSGIEASGGANRARHVVNRDRGDSRREKRHALVHEEGTAHIDRFKVAHRARASGFTLHAAARPDECAGNRTCGGEPIS
jgi:hypothetical protein